MSLDGKRILLGVSGSIAAYKAADLCSQLAKQGADVHIVLTAHAARFVGAPTFLALTRNPVLSDLFDEPHARRIAHIDLAQSADLVLAAPATANTIAKLAHGLADDMLSTCLLATPPATPLLIAPAMNTVMWEHPATVANLQLLRDRGARIIDPAYGLLACQDVGAGKLADVAAILYAVEQSLGQSQDLAGLRFLITSGATREPLDPVRFLTNRSSGRMGAAIAAEALARGGAVTLVSGHAAIAPPSGADVIRVESAAEMLEACQAQDGRWDVFIGAAAVADYAPETAAAAKIKKPVNSAAGETLTLRLKPTRDILATMGSSRRSGQMIVGFAAETENLVPNAKRKLADKGADLIAANDVTAPGAGFDVETNIVTLVSAEGVQALPLLPKREVAARLLDAIVGLRAARMASVEAGAAP